MERYGKMQAYDVNRKWLLMRWKRRKIQIMCFSWAMFLKNIKSWNRIGRFNEPLDIGRLNILNWSNYEHLSHKMIYIIHKRRRPEWKANQRFIVFSVSQHRNCVRTKQQMIFITFVARLPCQQHNFMMRYNNRIGRISLMFLNWNRGKSIYIFFDELHFFRKCL